ncbi:MAG TPA: TetR/AcrR family transcriptional regulator [Pseudomonadales bacterium]|nr:TetR/AcrR family transcriptional regulator [Pseudomonadales bacterium]
MASLVVYKALVIKIESEGLQMLTRLSRDQTQAQTRKRILDSARDVFAAKGVQAASVDWVAERAGFSKGALYSNFSSKREIVFALVKRYLEEEQEGLAMALAQHDQPTPLLEAVHQLYRYLESRPVDALLGTEFRLLAARSSTDWPEIAQLFIEHEQFLLAQFEAMTQRLGLSPAVGLSDWVCIMQGVTHGLLLQRTLQHEASPGILADTLLALMKLYFPALN